MNFAKFNYCKQSFLFIFVKKFKKSVAQISVQSLLYIIFICIEDNIYILSVNMVMNY